MDNDLGFGIGIGVFLGCLGTFILALIITSGRPNVRYVEEEDGSAYVCSGHKTIVIKDANSDKWFEPYGILLHLC